MLAAALTLCGKATSDDWSRHLIDEDAMAAPDLPAPYAQRFDASAATPPEAETHTFGWRLKTGAKYCAIRRPCPPT
jgi:hypothetical protein